MRDHGKMMWPLALLALAAACPVAAAQDAAQARTKTGTPAKPGGAVSSSYAAPASTDGESEPAQPEAAAREGTRTYTGGRRNADAPSAGEAALAPGQPIKGVIVKGGGPNKPAQAGQVPPTGTAKSISEKGVSSTKSR